MKKVIIAVVFLGVLFLANGQTKEKLVIGATPVPHAEILERAKSELAKKGIDLEIRVFTDYVTPNLALNDKSLDANYFQHVPYLNDFNKARNLSLVSVAAIHYEPLGLYSKKIKKLSELKSGDKIAVPNDATNEARSLIFLQKNGILKLMDPSNLKSTKNDIQSYAVKISIVEVDAAQLTRILPSVTAAVINGNYAIDARLNPAADAIVHEDATSVAAKTYGNIIAVRKGDENRPVIKALVDVLKSKEIKDFIDQKYKGSVLPID